MQPVVVDFREGASRQEFAAELRAALLASKLVVTTGVNPESAPREFWDEVSETLGDCVLLAEDAKTGQKLGQKWMEIRYDPRIPNAYRHSSEAQPLHTDGSYLSRAPEIVFFYCLAQAQAGGETTFIDDAELLGVLNEERPSLLEDLRSTPVRFSKADDEKTRPIISEDDRGTVLTWNYFCVDPSERAAVRAMADELHSFLQERVVARGLTVPVRLRPGDAVFFHDERLLHGRNAFDAAHMNDRFLWKTGFWLRRTD